MKVKVLSIRQPWAWLIVSGHKPLENREWQCPYRGPLYIHAGKTMSLADYQNCESFMDSFTKLELPAFGDLERGGIVGLARMNGCVDYSESPWFTGKFGFVMEDAKPLPFFKCNGMLGLFTLELPDGYGV